jgi:hypothetical protein
MAKTYSIVASDYIEGADAFIKTLAVGVQATLVREPANEHDLNAVAVWVEGRKVGYLPKKQNVAIAAFIDQTGEISPIGGLAMDGKVIESGYGKAIHAKFIRSPNSGYPQVQVSE